MLTRVFDGEFTLYELPTMTSYEMFPEKFEAEDVVLMYTVVAAKFPVEPSVNVLENVVPFVEYSIPLNALKTIPVVSPDPLTETLCAVDTAPEQGAKGVRVPLIKILSEIVFLKTLNVLLPSPLDNTSGLLSLSKSQINIP